MKNFFLLAVCAGTFSFVSAQLKMPAASPGQYVNRISDYLLLSFLIQGL